MSQMSLPVAVIGAGPIGLAAAAHLLARGESPLILEAGDSVGASIRTWAHVRVFSPWRYDMDAASIALLEQSGWTPPPLDGLPTGRELIERYLEPLASLPEIARHLRLSTRVGNSWSAWAYDHAETGPPRSQLLRVSPPGRDGGMPQA